MGKGDNTCKGPVAERRRYMPLPGKQTALAEGEMSLKRCAGQVRWDLLACGDWGLDSECNGQC